MNFFARYVADRRDDKQTEAREAAICDTNLAQVQLADPDARQIFTVTFTGAVNSRRIRDLLTEQIAAYAQAKALQGRLDLYNAVFAGL